MAIPKAVKVLETTPATTATIKAATILSHYTSREFKLLSS